METPSHASTLKGEGWRGGGNFPDSPHMTRWCEANLEKSKKGGSFGSKEKCERDKKTTVEGVWISGEVKNGGWQNTPSGVCLESPKNGY